VTTNIEVRFADGETAVVALDFKSHAVIDLVVRAWGILYQREVLEWKPTSAAAEFWYDKRTKQVNKYDDRYYHDELVNLLPIAALKKKLGDTGKNAGAGGQTGKSVPRE
jgi:hypothetical protein